MEDGNSVMQSAEQYGVNRMTLTRYISTKEKSLATSGYKVNQQHLQVFTETQEQDLCNHMKELANKLYGGTSSTCRFLDWQFADKNNIPILQSWYQNKMAG